MKDKYLIFATSFGTETISNNDATIQATTSLVNPVSQLNANSITNGILKVELTAHDGHSFGSAYGSPTAGDIVDVSAGCTVGASNGVVTLANHTADTTNGVTLDGTGTNNVVKLSLLRIIDGGGRMNAWPASKFKGIQLVDADEAKLFFEAATGDADDVDNVKLKFTGTFKQLCDMVNDAISSDKTGEAIVFAHEGRGIFFNGNPAGVTEVDITMDGA